MDLPAKIRTIPTEPGVYLYKNAEGEVIYVGKAKNLRSRVASYFHEGRWEDAKTGTLVREAADVEYIVVANNKEALALENNLIKQRKPRFNILLRDDKTYPYVKLTLGERWPRVYVTRRLRKDGSEYYGPYFPANLAYRITDLIHRNFLIPSCKVDLTRFHPRPCLQYYIKRCLGPCVKELTTPDVYQEAVRDVKLFLEGRPTDLSRSLHARMEQAAAAEEYERAARYRDLISTVEQLQERQRIAAAEGDDADVFGYHYENAMLAVNLFHMRGGKMVDRREFFWEDLPEFITDHVGTGAFARPGEQSSPAHLAVSADAPNLTPSRAPLGKDPSTSLRAGSRMRPSPHEQFHPGEFFSALLKQLYIGQPYVPRNLYVPVDFEDREELEDLLAEQHAGEGARATRVHILVPQRGDKRSLIDLAGNNAKQSYDQRFRVLKPNARRIQEELQEALSLPELPKRIECFDISHIQGAETVASMVVWEDGKMKKSDYRKFIIRTVEGVDDFASMREVVTRRYKRLLHEEKKPMPSLVLIDGGLGQLHAGAEALESLEIINQPLAAIAKREEILYVYGQERDPIALDHHSPVLHLIQMIRDEAHRFAVTFHRKRRQMRDRSTELLEIPGVGASTTRRLLEHFGSVQAVKQADAAALSAVVTRAQAEAIQNHFRK
ncbi:UvrABC system protein C [Candidatus Sulfotelmatobacter kueseliae]|uniref:UvrABC system protein C n=1 Tax=Candidatus Sulfotelmatobacter kueseliae TaxID=2042962 RepID=A0A2U3L0Q9_9BACT|nr:UvrABC system protein C [Candidatus Sulfotelmatobacter kueseliae]